MRVGFIATPDLGYLSGSSLSLRYTAMALAARNIECTVFCQRQPPQSHNDGVTYVELPMPLDYQVITDTRPKSTDLYECADLLVRAVLDRAVLDRDLDIVHAVYGTFTGLAGAVAASLLEIPLYISTFGRDIEVGARLDGRYHRMMQLSYGQADTILAADEIIAESVAGAFAGASTRTLVVPQAVNLELAGTFAREAAPGHRLLAVQSSFNLKKGLPLLIEALGVLARKYPDMTLTIVGHDDTPDAVNERKVRVLATNLGVLDRIRFAGHLTHIETLEQLASHDVFIDPRVIDSFSSCVYEAMAIGIPVVAADTACNRTALGDDEDSLFPLGDAAALAERVERVLDDPRQARMRGFVGRERAYKMRSYVGVEAVTDRLAEVYASGRCRR